MKQQPLCGRSGAILTTWPASSPKSKRRLQIHVKLNVGQVQNTRSSQVFCVFVYLALCVRGSTSSSAQSFFVSFQQLSNSLLLVLYQASIFLFSHLYPLQSFVSQRPHSFLTTSTFIPITKLQPSQHETFLPHHDTHRRWPRPSRLRPSSPTYATHPFPQ